MKIKTLFIFEILGKPAEHIKDSLDKMIDQLGEQKGLEVVRRVVHEPKLIEDDGKSDSKLEKLEKENYVKQGMYSTFAEVEVETENINLIMAIVLNMLPSHVEILQPSEFSLNNTELSGLMSELTVKMHKYDEVTKVLMLEKDYLIKKLKEAEDKVSNFEGEVKGVDEKKEDNEHKKIDQDNVVDIEIDSEKNNN
ncbi:hypothetical protein CMI43_01120 [Candidatus Pacearchaeota archaeon]|jgi:hypothetical protein|nr:hypothetical protein [Candidatus Pacearchaeota archaeon]|tara:strand:- start:1309 stop:1893 length:585 start_codon:yes stop_codon:yes gene_type:complete